MEDVHAVINQVVFDDIAFAAVVDGGIGAVVNFVVGDAVPASAAVDADGAWVDASDAMDVVIIDDAVGAAHIDAAGAAVIDLAVLDAGAEVGGTSEDAVSGHPVNFQAEEAALFGVSEGDCAVKTIGRKAAGLERGRGDCQGETLQRDGFDFGVRPALKSDDGLTRGRDHGDFCHVLSWFRPVDQAVAGAIMVPLAGFGHAFAQVPEDIFLNPKRSGRMTGLGIETQETSRRIMGRQPDTGFVPHVVDGDFRVGKAEPISELTGGITQLGQLIRGGLTFPASPGGAHPGHREIRSVRQKVLCREPGGWHPLAIDLEHSNLPLARFGFFRRDSWDSGKAGQVRCLPVFTLGAPLGEALSTKQEGAFTGRCGDVKAGIGGFQEEMDVIKMSSSHNDTFWLAWLSLPGGIPSADQGGKRFLFGAWILIVSIRSDIGLEDCRGAGGGQAQGEA